MPFLDARALETDPDGMAFLRSVIRPNFDQEQAVLPRLRDEALDAAAQGQTEAPKPTIPSEAAAVPVG